jgi:predicted N-acetyltransferase YhbS
MSVTLTPARPEHIDELGRICYEAFKDISGAHGFPPDFPSVQIARQVMASLVERPDYYGVTAMDDGQIVWSNFMSLTDPVAGVGPITVDCAFQGRDIGRTLMSDVIRYAREHGIAMVRLVQDAYNTGSISLYASLGFETRHPLAVMRPAPARFRISCRCWCAYGMGAFALILFRCSSDMASGNRKTIWWRWRRKARGGRRKP